MKKIVNSLQDLQVFDNKGSSVEKVIGIVCDYRMLYVQHNYVFYTVTKDKVIIVDIYNEKEDFMWQMAASHCTHIRNRYCALKIMQI